MKSKIVDLINEHIKFLELYRILKKNDCSTEFNDKSVESESSEHNTEPEDESAEQEIISERLAYLRNEQNFLPENVHLLYDDIYDDQSSEKLGYAIDTFNHNLLKEAKSFATSITISSHCPPIYQIIDVIANNKVCRSISIDAEYYNGANLLTDLMFVNALNSAPNLHSINFSIGEQGEGDGVDPIEVAKFLSGKLNKNLDLIITWTCGVFFIKEKDKEQVLAVLLKETTSSQEITSSEEPASDEENQYLQIIYNDGVLALEDFQSNIEDANNFNTISIYRGIVSGLVEYDDDVKLDTSQYYHNLDIVHIKSEQEFDSWRLIDYAARHQHTLLIHELHRIGKIDLKTRNSDDKTVLEIAVTYGTPEVIAALLGLSLPLPLSDDIYLSYDNKVVLDIELFDSRTVLMVAAADGKKENLDLLLRLGANFNKVHNQNKKTALDYALAQQHNDCVLSLLKSGAKFPKKWIPSVDNRLEEFYKECSTIAASLKKGELIKIESYLETKKLTVHFLSTDNHSAPYIAFLAKQYEIYAMLRSKGFALIEEEQIDIQLLSTQDRTLLQQHMISFSNKHAYSSINFLMSKSRILQPSNQHFKTIHHVYKTLSEIPEVLHILRVLEYSGKHFDILFDFEKDSVEEISASSSQNAAGSCAFKVGYVFVAGKTELCQLMGTTAHELTHQAIDVLYNNACNPFSSQEIDAIKQLTDIEEKSEGLAENDIIKRVFKCYKKEDWHAEIIVRVPHILATYDSDQGSKLLEIEAPGLRSFYEEYVTEKCKLFIHEVQKRGSKDLSLETTLDTSTGIPSITNTIFNILIQNHYISRKLINYVYQDELLAINTVISKPYVKSSTIPNIQLVLQKHPLEWNYDDFKKIKLIVHPDKGGNSEDFLTVNVFQKQVGDKDQIYQSLLPKLLQTIQIMTYKANIGFKMLDTIVDSGRLVYEPTIQNAKKVILDSVYLYSMSSGVNGLVGAIIGSETLYQTYLGDYAQAFKTTVITIAYMALPKLLTYTAVPHLGLTYGIGMVVYTGYSAITNSHSFYLERNNDAESTYKSAIAYKDLMQTFSKSPLQKLYDFATIAKLYEILINNAVLELEKTAIKTKLEEQGVFGQKLYKYIHEPTLEEKYDLSNKILQGRITKEEAETLKAKHISINLGAQSYEHCREIRDTVNDRIRSNDENDIVHYHCYNEGKEMLDHIVIGNTNIQVIEHLV